MKWERKSKRMLACGSVLPLVLGILLILSILVTSLLRMPGILRRTVLLILNETQEMYLAESAVLANLECLPEGYFAELPSVESRILGPWMEWHVDSREESSSVVRMSENARPSGSFRFLLGNEFGRFSTSEWAACASLLERNLQERILQSEFLKKLSGNRRFFELDSSAAFAPMAINVSAGDLTLDLNGRVKSFMANVEGDVKIRGKVHFDTLRIYASGTVLIQGNVSADFVEIFGIVGIELSENALLAGLLLSKLNIQIADRAKANYPSVAVAVGYRGNTIAMRGKSVFDGVVLAPSGIVERDSSTKLLDSSKALLPFCMDSRLVVFDRRRL